MSDNYSNYPPGQGAPFPVPQAPPPQGSSGKAIASMVLGIIALVSCCFVYVSLPCSLVAVILGGVSRKNNENGRGMAIAGIVTGIIALALGVITIVIIALGISALDSLYSDILDIFDLGDLLY